MRRVGGGSVWLRWSLVAWLGLSGCGRQPATETVDREESPGADAETATEGHDTAVAPSSAGKKSTAKKGSGNKRKGPGIGEIPRDAWPEIFFDNPSAVAAEAGSRSTEGAAPTPPAMAGGGGNAGGAGTPNVAATGPSSPDKPAGADPTPESGGTEVAAGGVWTDLLPADAFADEAKSLRANLTSKLQSVGQYNGAFREVQVDAAVLAALAQMAEEYPEAPSWKKHAPLVRDTAAELCREASSVGDKFFKPTKEAFDKLDSLMSGSVPPGLGESPPKLSYQAFAPRLALMKRLDRSHGWLKSNVNTADLLKKEGERVIREAGVLGALSQVILTGGYDDADDEKYQELVTSVRDGAKGLVAAARETDFEAYQKSLDAVYKGCTTCHSEFKNN